MTYTKLPPGWQPNPALAQAVLKALRAMSVHWPRALAIVNADSQAASDFVTDYARATFGIDREAIEEAGRRWIAENTSPPRPIEFAQLAREVARELRPPQYGATPGAVPPIEASLFQSAIEQRSRRAFAFVGGWPAVSEVWAVCLEDATSDEERADVRFGRVPLATFDLAIEAVLAGRRSIPRGGLAG